VTVAVNARCALVQSIAVALGSLVSYLLVTNALAGVHSLSHADDLIGGLWAVLATVFVVRATYGESVAAAKSRGAATAFSFVLCFVYLIFLPFHAWGLAVLLGVGTLVLAAIGRSGDTPVAGITTAVVMVAAAVNPRAAWQQPLLRAVDTAVGIAVGLTASWLATHATRREYDMSSTTIAAPAPLSRFGEAPWDR
jgi:uncharacterized membrane protein YccC